MATLNPNIRRCPYCSSVNRYSYSQTTGAEHHHPPGLRLLVTAFRQVTIREIICADCGLMLNFVDKTMIKAVEKSDFWEQIG
jgi:hypothetical protein